MSDKALQKQLQREAARLQTEPRNPASKCDCAIAMRKKDVQIQKVCGFAKHSEIAFTDLIFQVWYDIGWFL